MHEVINDPIDVIVSFTENKVIPKLFKWNKRNYKIETINLVHTKMEGKKKIFYFSVSDLTNYFKLKLDTDCLEWHLIELYTVG